jgi:hypothetical protein
MDRRSWIGRAFASALALACQRVPTEEVSETTSSCVPTDCRCGEVAITWQRACICDPSGDYCRERNEVEECVTIPAACADLEDEALGDCVAQQLCEEPEPWHDSFYLECDKPQEMCAGTCDLQSCDTEGPLVGNCGEARNPASCAFSGSEEDDCAWRLAVTIAIVDGECSFGIPFGHCEITGRDDGCGDYEIAIRETPDGAPVLVDYRTTCWSPSESEQACDEVTDETLAELCACRWVTASPFH